MAFNRYKANGVTTETTVLTVPADTAMVVIGVHVANTDGTDNVEYIAKLGDTVLAPGIPITPQNAHSLLDGKIVLVEGDTITVEATGTVDVVVSVLEEAV